MRWTRIEDGYESGDARIFDNGGGLGPAKGGGRWAIEIRGRWIANVDTLAAAKARAELATVKPTVDRTTIERLRDALCAELAQEHPGTRWLPVEPGEEP